VSIQLIIYTQYNLTLINIATPQLNIMNFFLLDACEVSVPWKPEDITSLNSRQPDFTQILINRECDAVSFCARTLSDTLLKNHSLRKSLKLKKKKSILVILETTLFIMQMFDTNKNPQTMATKCSKIHSVITRNVELQQPLVLVTSHGHASCGGYNKISFS